MAAATSFGLYDMPTKVDTVAALLATFCRAFVMRLTINSRLLVEFSVWRAAQNGILHDDTELLTLQRTSEQTYQIKFTRHPIAMFERTFAQTIKADLKPFKPMYVWCGNEQCEFDPFFTNLAQLEELVDAMQTNHDCQRMSQFGTLTHTHECFGHYKLLQHQLSQPLLLEYLPKVLVRLIDKYLMTL
jgi:hypothetical protein